MQKLSIDELVVLEKKHDLWKYTLFDYPIWIHCREPLVSSGMMAQRKINRPHFIIMLKSFFQTLIFLMQQKKYDKVFFLMERAELLEIYNQDKSNQKLLFLNREQDKIYAKNDYISSDFLSLLRLLSRKISYIIFRKKYNKIVKKLYDIGCEASLNEYVKIALGDALFLKFLSFILSKKNKKYYTGAVIPMGEKFVNALNSYEVQHGVIHPAHIGYIGLPEIKNSLILYSRRYETIMNNCRYKGNLIVNEYKRAFFEKDVKRYFPIVIYTQPTKEMQESVNEFIKKSQSKNLFIQKHPKDYFDYDIDAEYFVTATTPFEVGYPIFYLSSVIENFTLYNKRCYIYDLEYTGINLEEFLSIYTRGSTSKIIIHNNLTWLYNEILGDMACAK